ncbi:MAG: hypothetical protein WCA46_25860, partial [Actinocatenispora sp.]
AGGGAAGSAAAVAGGVTPAVPAVAGGGPGLDVTDLVGPAEAAAMLAPETATPAGTEENGVPGTGIPGAGVGRETEHRPQGPEPG